MFKIQENKLNRITKKGSGVSISEYVYLIKKKIKGEIEMINKLAEENILKAVNTGEKSIEENLKENIKDSENIAMILIETEKFKSDGDCIYSYDDKYGYYKKLMTRQSLMDSINSYVKPCILLRKVMADVVYIIKSSLEIRIKEDAFNKESARYINCSNGVLDIETMELLEHSSKYMFNYCNYANYIESEEVTSSAFDSWCDTSLEGDSMKRQLFLEQIGYTLSPTLKAKKACFIVGPKHCGKSTMQNVLIDIIDRKNISSIALQDLSSRFSNSQLSDVRVNMQFEVSNQTIKDINDFKAVVGGDYCKGEKKGGALYTFRHKAKLLFAGNHLPPLHNPQMSDIYVDRIALLKLNKTIKKEDWDLSLEDKLLSQKDKIYTLSMKAYKTLYDNNFNFTIPSESIEYLESYQLDLDNVQGFFNQYCEYNRESRVFTRTLYEFYAKYCEDNSINPYKVETFSKQLVEITEIRPKMIRITGLTPSRGFEGVKLVSS